MRMRTVIIGLLVASLFLSFEQTHSDVKELELGQTTIFYIVTEKGGLLTADSNLLSAEEIVNFIRIHDDWIFEIRCHTDSRSRKDFNLKLSELRARNLTLDLIRSFDIDESRLIPVGCGEEFLIIPDSVISIMANKEMKELAHGINRRFELKAVRLFVKE